MSLTDFFRISLPYGIQKNANGTWTAFNREYLPLGWCKSVGTFPAGLNSVSAEFPIHIKFKKLTDKQIIKTMPSDLVQFSSTDQVSRVYFYNDHTNPSDDPNFWPEYNKYIVFFSSQELVL